MVIGGPKKNKNDGMTTYNFFFFNHFEMKTDHAI